MFTLFFLNAGFWTISALRKQKIFTHQEIGQKKNAVAWKWMSLQACVVRHCPQGSVIGTWCSIRMGVLEASHWELFLMGFGDCGAIFSPLSPWWGERIALAHAHTMMSALRGPKQCDIDRNLIIDRNHCESRQTFSLYMLIISAILIYIRKLMPINFIFFFSLSWLKRHCLV